MNYPFESAKVKKPEISLWVLERYEWSWRNLGCGLFLKRAKIAAKAAALVAQDRILTGEFISRDLPSFYGDGK